MPNHVTHSITITGPEAEVAKLKEKMMITEEQGRGEYKRMVEVFDFNKVIPRPPEIDAVISGSITSDGLAMLGYTRPMFRGAPRYVGIENSLREYLDYPWVKEQGITDAQGVLAMLRERYAEHKGDLDNDPEMQAKLALKCYDKYGSCDWYDWSIKNWGTKWGAYDYHEIDRSEGRWAFKFDTAWSPPEPVLRKLAEDHPELTLEVSYFDEGWCFCGVMESDDGELYDNCFDGSIDARNNPMHRRIYVDCYGEDPEPEEDEDDEE